MVFFSNIDEDIADRKYSSAFFNAKLKGTFKWASDENFLVT